jgi:SWI/SNF-related matrix-associated actin-dependent regulator 1 of chromatin subfamily A
MDRVLDAQAERLRPAARTVAKRSDAAFRKAAELANGLFPHQIEGVAFLLGRTRAILADDMGLGKTRQAIVALRHRTRRPSLVVSPASVRSATGRGDRHRRHRVRRRTSSKGHGARALRLGHRQLRHPCPSTSTPSKPAWAGIVFDEAHYLKNHTSMRSRLARRLADRAKSQGRRGPAIYLLTGTPLTNRPRDLFVLLQLVGHPLGRSFLSFAKRYCAAERNEYGWQTRGASNVDELTVQLHGVMLRRSKDDVLALPPKLRMWLTVEVPKGTGVRDMRKAVELMISHERVAPGSSIDELRLRGRLLQAVTKARQALAAAKVPSTIDFVSGATEQGEKVIVFSCFKEPMQRLSRHFGDAAVLLTGKTPSDKRQALVDRFQEDPQIRVSLANIVAGGIGTNLTAATQVVFNDLDWVPPPTGRGSRLPRTDSKRQPDLSGGAQHDR